jgi:hypothetical protein
LSWVALSRNLTLLSCSTYPCSGDTTLPIPFFRRHGTARASSTAPKISALGSKIKVLESFASLFFFIVCVPFCSYCLLLPSCRITRTLGAEWKSGAFERFSSCYCPSFCVRGMGLVPPSVMKKVRWISFPMGCD